MKSLSKLGCLILPIFLILQIGSCKSIAPFARPSMDSASIKAALADPFKGPDHEQVTRDNLAAIMIEHRVKPASIIAGKKSLTLTDCRNIALERSLDIQVARMEELTKEAVAFSNRTKLLPHFIFSGDLSQRDNLAYSYSDVLGQEGRSPNPGGSGLVTNYSTAHERSTWRYALETRWSPTDAALAYYLTRSSINDRIKSGHQRVRVAQKLITIIDAAFFRLLALQECLPIAESMLTARTSISSKMKIAYQKKIVNVVDYSRAQQNEIKAKRTVKRIRNEMEKQRNILASSLSLSPDICIDGGFKVEGELIIPDFNDEICQLEFTAVKNRPEALEAGLNHLNSVNDLRRTIVKYFPRITGFWRLTRDKDKFLYNKDWKEVGVSVYFDLLDWATNWGESKAARMIAAKTQREIGTVGLAITSQVRTSALQYWDTMDQLQSSQSSLESTKQVLTIARERASRDDLDRLALEEARGNYLQEKIELVRAVGEANAALADLQGAMGTNFRESDMSGIK